MNDSKFLVRRQNAESVDAKVGAATVLSQTDFTKQMGSGILLTLTNFTTGQTLTAEFSLAAEDMEIIKVEILASLRRSLESRKEWLTRDIASIDKVLGNQATAAKGTA